MGLENWNEAEAVGEQNDIMQVEGINSKGYGTISKLFMQDKRLSAVAKAIYAYFCSYAGAGQQAFPRVNKIMQDLVIGKNAYYKYFNQLLDCGYIKVEQKRINGRLSHNIYTLVQMIPKPVSPCTQIRDTVKQDTEIAPCTQMRDTAKWDTTKSDIYNNNSSEKQQCFNINNDGQSCLSSPSLTDGQDSIYGSEQKEMNVFVNRVKEKIGYKDLQAGHPFEVDLVKEIVSVIVDVLISDSSHVRIEGEDKPRELVKHVFSRLTYDHVEFTIKQFKNFSGKILKKRQYIITMLYNSYHELDAHYINEVKSDSG